MNKKSLLLALIIVTLFACKETPKEASAEATIENIEAKEVEWVSLFDGKTFKGWHNYATDTISDQWQISDGAMVFTPHPDKQGGVNNLVTDSTYTNFKLSLEWKISEGGNSGIFWSVFEDDKYSVPYLTGPEIQVLDDLKHPDKENATHRSGALYDMIAPSQNVVKEVGEWNLCVLEINHKTNLGKVWLNDVKIVEFPVNGEGWNALIANSKFKDWDGFGKFATGKIGLQDHGNQVWYRAIKIQELD